MAFPLYYFGPVSWYVALAQADQVTFTLGERFAKRTWRNRCRILGSNGPINLSVYLQHPNDKLPTADIRVSYVESWQKDHWLAIRSAYGRSPWFDFYGDAIAALFEKQPEFLHEWNTLAFDTINQLLGLQLAPHSSFKPADPAAAAQQEKQFGSARNPAEPQLFRDNEPYIQVFADRFGFVPNLSILDVLFNLGPESSAYLKRQNLNP